MFKYTGSLINSTETDISEYLICLKNDEVEINFYVQFPQQDFLDFEMYYFLKMNMIFFLVEWHNAYMYVYILDPRDIYF